MAVADLLERKELDLEVVLLLEGEEEVVSRAGYDIPNLTEASVHRTAQGFKMLWRNIPSKLVG